MFAFYFAALSSITPPVALASYAAAGIAGESANKVSFESMRIGIVGFIVPFFFIFNPHLLLTGGTVPQYIFAAFTAIIGSVAIAAAIKGYLLRETTIIERILFIIGGAVLIDTNLLLNLLAIGLLSIGVFLQITVKKKINVQSNDSILNLGDK